MSTPGMDDPLAKPLDSETAASIIPPLVTQSTNFIKRKNRGSIRKKEDLDVEADPSGTAGGGGGEDGKDTDTLFKRAKLSKAAPLAFTTKREGRMEDVGHSYESSRAIQSGVNDLATRTLETETEHGQDARALREQKMQQALVDGSVADDGTYKGLNSYIDYRQAFRREHTIASEKGSGAHGPLRGSTYVRMTARMDYQPDVCKDYKETGFCSYGDACKFMHDRGDYKSGWEMERQWEDEQKAMRKAKLEGWDPDKELDEDELAAAAAAELDDGIPFACYICRKAWEECKNPVVSRCRHYFCESCALKHNAKSQKCAACDQPTQGIFNEASDVVKKMRKLSRVAS